MQLVAKMLNPLTTIGGYGFCKIIRVFYFFQFNFLKRVIVLLSCFPCVILIVGCILLLVLAIIFSPCIIVLVIVKWINSKKKSKNFSKNFKLLSFIIYFSKDNITNNTFSMSTKNESKNLDTTINLETDSEPPTYDELNFDKLKQNENNTDNSTVMISNFSDQIMPVLPSPLNSP